MKILPNFISKNPGFRIVDFLAENPKIGFTKEEIRRSIGMPKSAFSSTWRELQEFKVVRGKKAYKLNKNSKLAKAMWNVEKVCAMMER